MPSKNKGKTRAGTDEQKAPSLFSRYLRMLRTDRGLSISGLAEASGVSAPYITNLEGPQDHTPTKSVLEKLANGLEIDPFDRQILFTAAAATRQSSPFVPGLDVIVDKSLVYQESERVKEVYLVAENMLELHDQEFFDVTASNIKERGVKYNYFMRDPENFHPLQYRLEESLGVKSVKDCVSCVVSTNPFLFLPGFVIFALEDPVEIVGLFAKWAHGVPCRVYQMEPSASLPVYHMLRTVQQTLQHKDSYISAQFGTLTREFPRDQ